MDEFDPIISDGANYFAATAVSLITLLISLAIALYFVYTAWNVNRYIKNRNNGNAN